MKAFSFFNKTSAGYPFYDWVLTEPAVQIVVLGYRGDQTRLKKFVEGGVYTQKRANDIPLTHIQACAQDASLKCLRG